MEIPSGFYYLLGSVIAANLGTLVGIWVVTLKSAWWLSKLDSRVDNARDMAVRAHKRIDTIKGDE